MVKIAGRYEVIAPLGEGGMGVVYRAYAPPPMNRYVAVKTLPRGADPRAVDLFLREYEALKSLAHPNIVDIFDMGEFEDDGFRKPFFVMPLLSGQTLHQLIYNPQAGLNIERIVEIFVQICRGLQAAHEHGLIHRDLKPSNIFVLADDAVKVIDFGVARIVSMESRTTVAGGTLEYMAPEILQHKPVSVRSDIYSLGVTLYEALTRQRPFSEGSDQSTADRILTHNPTIASKLNPEVNYLLSKVAHKAMAKEAKSRFATAREFSLALQKAARNEPISGFEPAQIRVRIQNAQRALETGDHRLAREIADELEAEGEIDPELATIRTRLNQETRRARIVELLESARGCYNANEDRLAKEKLDELLELEPGNTNALTLRERVETRITDTLLKPWIDAAERHRKERAYARARESIQSALEIRPGHRRVLGLLSTIEAEEQQHSRAVQQKTEAHQSATQAWASGDLERALTHMRRVLELERIAPSLSPETAATYREFNDRLLSEAQALPPPAPDPPRDEPPVPHPVSPFLRPEWRRPAAIALAAFVTIVVIVLTWPTGRESARPPTPTPSAPPLPVATNGVLQIRGLPADLQVSLDGTKIGLVGADGAFSYEGVTPGAHEVGFVGNGYQPTTISKTFAAGVTTIVTASDVVMARTPTPVRFAAEPDTQVTILAPGREPERFNGSKTIPLPEGTYTVSVVGRAGIETSRSLKVAAGAPRLAVDTSTMLVRGMEGFDPGGWTEAREWVTRRGGGLVLYRPAVGKGAFRFTVRLDDDGNPFSTGDRLTWMVAYINERNFVRFQIDRRQLTRTDFVDGVGMTVAVDHHIPTNLPFVHLSIELTGARLVHRFSTDGSTWQVIDNWERTASAGGTAKASLEGRFGFLLANKDGVFLSNFVYDPRSQ